jgi:uncharacterized protein
MTSLYDVTIPMFIRSLQNLDAIMKKAEEHAKANNLSLNDFTEARLAPDMHPLPFQVQTACNTAKFVVVRVGGQENVPQEDNEKTFEELHARIAKTLEILGKAKREDFEGKEESEVIYRDRKFKGLVYCTMFAIPNFYFHIMATYAILRNKGVQVGKMDYLGALSQA